MMMNARRILLAFLGLVLFSVASVAQDGAGEQENAQAEVQAATDALINVLNDPKSRAALIEMLKKSGDGSEAGSDEASSSGGEAKTTGSALIPGGILSGGTTATEEASDESDAKNGLVLRIGEYTRQVADEIGVVIGRAGYSLRGLRLVANGDIPVKWDRVHEVLVQVAVVLAGAYAAFLLAQFVARLIYPGLALRARYGGGLMRSFILLLSTLIEAMTVAIGLGVGYLVALVAYGGFDAGVTLQESLALNAFFITGMSNVALRFVFAPRRPELRLLPFSDVSAIYWNSRLRLFMYWVNYGVFLAVPVANIAVSFVLGNGLRLLVVLVGMIYLMALVKRNRVKVRRGARSYAGTLQSSLAQKALVNLGNLWHLGAYGYVIAVFVIWVTRPFDATTIILRATGLSIVTIMAGIVLSLVVTRAIKGGIRLPDEMNSKLPALQHRLNAFVPRLLKIIRFAVFLGTLLMLLEVWGLLSVTSWLYSDTGTRLLSRYGSAILEVIIGFVIWLAVMSWVDLRLQSRTGYIVTARERTLFQLFRNAFTVVIIIMILLLALSEIGLDIAPLIAGAGVLGLAISFGAQTLVKDIITGAFIQIENAINEGDVVTVAGITGTVEGITVRSVRLRDLEGTTHIIPFSSVDMVSNFMRGFSYHVALIGVSYDTDISYAKEAMSEAFRRLVETDFRSKILGELEMHGVTNFGASSIDIRARIKTTPGDQWSVGRAYNEFVKQVFDERGIEIPFPQVTYHSAAPAIVEEDMTRDKAGKPNLKPRKLTGDAPPES